MALKVTTFSSKGRVTRIYSYKTNRVHHLQSDNQLNLFLILERCNSVVDIKENIELRNIEIIITDTDDLNLDKFTDKETGQLYQLHTNFLIKASKNGTYEQIAISVKSLSELQRKTVIEKMEIEQRYWKAKGIKFYLITEKEIDKKFVENIKWVRESLIDNTVQNKKEVAEKLYYFMQKNTERIIQEVLDEFEEENKVKKGMGLFALRYLIGNREIYIDMKNDIDLNEKVAKVITF